MALTETDASNEVLTIEEAAAILRISRNAAYAGLRGPRGLRSSVACSPLDRQGGAPWMGSGHRGRSEQHGVRVSRSRLLLVTSRVAVQGLVLDRGATP
jgi:hypothetical protein